MSEQHTSNSNEGDTSATVDDRSEPTAEQREAMVTKPERSAAKAIVPFVLLALILATLVTSFLTRRWEFLLALLVFVPYLFLLSAPLWLASATKAADKASDQA
jgi:hypothetical protein